MTLAASGDVLMPEGPLSFDSLPAVLAQARALEGRSDLPRRLTIDFSRVSDVDSAALALLLEWRRIAERRGVELAFTHLPANLLALASLYGIEQLVQPTAP